MRQEAEIYRNRILAQGLVDIGIDKDMKATGEAFKKFVSSLLPFTQKQQQDSDRKMVEAMHKEVKKGVILFKPEMANPLSDRAKKMQMPDDIRKKIAAARVKRKTEL